MARSTARLEQRIAEEQQAFARPLRSLLKRPALTCAPGITVAEAAARMRAEGVGSLVVVDEAGRALGIVTNQDVVGGLAASRSTGPVSEIMTPNPFSLPGHALAYEAAVAMIAQRIRHVLVTEEGRLAGVVSERDLFSLQRLGLGELAMEIRLAAGIDILAGLAAEVRALTRALVEQGVGAEQLTLFVSVLNDRISQRALEIVRKRHDLERIRWCWLAFGSEGRFEQTFSSDQDNGLMFETHDGAAPAAARARLLPFAREVNEALDACGYPLCKGNVMASNPELCLSLDEWKAKMARWIDVTLPKALLDASICFDFRALHGDITLSAALREWVSARVRAHPAFLRHLAEAALQGGPALGRFGGFATEAGMINLKLHGVKVFVDAARVYALAHGLPQTNTADRLRAAARHIGLRDVDAIADAFYVIQSLRLRIQKDGSENRVAPEKLNRLERATLKEALRLGRELQERLALDYQL
jgi:CBS domain-containing protein